MRVIFGLATLVASLAALSAVAVADGAPEPGSSLDLRSVPNLRDVGGYATHDGAVVMRGVAYRSNQLNRIAPEDLKKLAALGLKRDFDLRTAEERRQKPDELPPDVGETWLNVLADARGTRAAEVMRLLANPREANEALGGGKAEQMMLDVYKEFVDLPSAKQAYRQLFIDLSEPGFTPALYHCTAGKDRTGWATAALLSLLGVPEDQVYADYLRSNDYMLPAYAALIKRFTDGGGDPAIITAILGVEAEYLKAAFDEMRAKYGSIEGYFKDGLGIDKAGRQRLRERFLAVK